MKSGIFFLLAGTVGYTEAEAQLDYSSLYEHYKHFEQNKTVTLYLTGSHLYGKYNNVNMLLLAANLPQIDPNAQAVGWGGMISQDRLLVGSDMVLFHNLFSQGSYSQTGAFSYFYAGCKFYDGEKAEAGVLTGFGLGYLNILPNGPSSALSSEPSPTGSCCYTLYNIKPLRAGIFLYNFALAYNYHCSKKLSIGLLAGLDCMPASAWNIGNSATFTNITQLQEGNAKGYISITTGYYFDR
jgi:hypothetical protein